MRGVQGAAGSGAASPAPRRWQGGGTGPGFFSPPCSRARARNGCRVPTRRAADYALETVAAWQSASAACPRGRGGWLALKPRSRCQGEEEHVAWGSCRDGQKASLPTRLPILAPRGPHMKRARAAMMTVGCRRQGRLVRWAGSAALCQRLLLSRHLGRHATVAHREGSGGKHCQHCQSSA